MRLFPRALVVARLARLASLAWLVGLSSLLPGRAHAQSPAPLTHAEETTLRAGGSVVRPQTVLFGGRRYVGGIAYAVVSARPDQVRAVLDDPAAMREIVPRTQAIEPITRAGSDLLFELHHGNSVVHAKYTLIVRLEDDKNRMRFWLDRSRPHALDDAWGYFRYDAFESTEGPRVLVTYGILMDLGAGLIEALYGERVRAMALTVPQRLREYVERAGRPAKRA